MRRLLIALALVAAACGGSAAPTSADRGEDTAAATSSSSMAQSDSTAGPQRDRPEGPDAPQFVLALGQGGEFDLAAEQKPVHMVFWAEW